MSLVKACPKGYTFVFEDTKKISFTPKEIIMPHEFNNEVVLPTIMSLYSEFNLVTPKRALTQLALDHWKEVLKGGTKGADYIAYISAVYSKIAPQCILDNINIKTCKKSRSGKFALLKFSLSYAPFQTNTKTGATVEHYIKLKPDDSVDYIITNSKEKQEALQEINTANYKKVELHTLLSNISNVEDRNSAEKVIGIHEVSDTRIVLSNGTRAYNFSVERFTDHRFLLPEEHFVVPKIIIGSDEISFGAHLFAKIRSANVPTHPYSFDGSTSLRLYGARYVKGAWRPSTSKDCIIPYSKEEAVTDMIDFIEGGARNPLLSQLYDVYTKGDKYAILHSKTNRHHYLIKHTKTDIQILDIAWNNVTLLRHSEDTQALIDEVALIEDLSR